MDDQEFLWTGDLEPLFIVGAPRSGTTWVQALLASHPLIATGQETHFFKDFSGAEAAYREDLPRPVGLQHYLPNGQFYRLCAETFIKITSRLPRPQGRVRYFLEKTPEHALHAEFILKCFPTARFLHVVRDPRHMAASLIRTELEFGRSRWYMNATIASRVWRNSVTAARRIRDLVAEPDQYLEVRYEALRCETADELARLFGSLGLEASPSEVACYVEANSLENATRSAGFSAIRAVENHKGEPRGFFGTGRTATDSFDLSRTQLAQVERLTGDLMFELGYVQTRPKTSMASLLCTSWKVRKFLGLPPA